MKRSGIRGGGSNVHSMGRSPLPDYAGTRLHPDYLSAVLSHAGVFSIIHERPEGFDRALICNYSTYMKSTQIKIARIGNSRGVRLPAASLRRYHIGETVIMEERSEGILLRPTGPAVEKLSWQDTASAMAASEEDWSDWDSTSDDGLAAIPWEDADQRRVAEKKARYAVSKRSKRR